MKIKVYAGALVVLCIVLLYALWSGSGRIARNTEVIKGAMAEVSVEIAQPPNKKTLGPLSHVHQTFNNCSSVALMAALSYWEIRDTQEAIAEATRPWNDAVGNNDDKSVTLYELAAYAHSTYGLATFVRPNGNLDLLKQFVANDIPVIARTLMYPDDDIVHYRVVRGYDDEAQRISESDGVYGPDVSIPYEQWMKLWKNFNYSYLIVVPEEKQALVETILGSMRDERLAWEVAKERAESELSMHSSDTIAHVNLITALSHLGEHEAAVNEFEKIESRLTRRVLWYQHEPIESYFKLQEYDRVLSLTGAIIGDNNKSVSELYILRGKIFEIRGDVEGARAEYERAAQYHKHLQSAKDALAALSE